MNPTPIDTSTPDALPVLSRGSHRTPARGACFMEYTSLLAGEPFSDAPGCVDPELAGVLRSANDMLSDAARPSLVPLLGRAIGLVVPASGDRADGRWRWLRRDTRTADAQTAAQTRRLHALVSTRYVEALALSPADLLRRGHVVQPGLRQLFWDLMEAPTPTRTSEEYTNRLVTRLELLHRCFEETLTEMGLRDPEPRASAPAFEPVVRDVRAVVPAQREPAPSE